ncbi:peptide chain release factor N(5)-glutamine methyltransferase [Chryseobacterium sp. CT-SW4]|uniref:peptide chain release factor N(5)-glutamine methyltransferase n=1 Tax=Chryseobacterium sp. SW-1 TaxID=3157343 RepID=UPI003B024A68
MTIQELKRYFQTELNDLYTESETHFLYSVFIQKIIGLNSFQQRNLSHQELLIDDEKQIKNSIIQLKSGRPYQQVLGETEFFGMHFFVDENVLIPRPETEELLELAIQKIKSHSFPSDSIQVLDIGTGSGIIPIVLKKHFPQIKVYSIDTSEKALETAKKNAAFHETPIHFIHDNYLEMDLDQVYDIIISNPPYIGIDEEHEIADSVKEFEPKMALFSPTEDPLIFYKKIARDTEKHLEKNGLLFLEINQKLGAETLNLYSSSLSEFELIKDLSENDRFIYGRK